MGPKHRVVKKPVEKRPPSKQQRVAKENAPAGGKVYTSKEVKTTTVVKNGMLTKTVTTITTGPDGQKHTAIEEHTEMVKGLRQHNRKPLEPLPIHGVEDAPSGNWGRPTSSHGTPSPPQAPLKWRDDLARDAQKAANACVDKGHLFHSNHPNAGQNAAWNYPTFECSINGWYNEVHNPGYDFNNGGFTGGTGHFTQVVW